MTNPSWIGPEKRDSRNVASSSQAQKATFREADLGVSCNWFNWDLSSVGTATFGILEGQHSQFGYYIQPSLMVSRATQGYRNRAVASGEGTC